MSGLTVGNLLLPSATALHLDEAEKPGCIARKKRPLAVRRYSLWVESWSWDPRWPAPKPDARAIEGYEVRGVIPRQAFFVCR
jgi:hypothetical protein